MPKTRRNTPLDTPTFLGAFGSHFLRRSKLAGSSILVVNYLRAMLPRTRPSRTLDCRNVGVHVPITMAR
jgi:hypothetical protein